MIIKIDCSLNFTHKTYDFSLGGELGVVTPHCLNHPQVSNAERLNALRAIDAPNKLYFNFLLKVPFPNQESENDAIRFATSVTTDFLLQEKWFEAKLNFNDPNACQRAKSLQVPSSVTASLVSLSKSYDEKFISLDGRLVLRPSRDKL
jgi:hypothetical protein